MNPFRTKHPTRTCTKGYSDFHKYKPSLRADFSKRCGYTDSPEFWLGGHFNFHIDHFKPHSKPAYAHLKNDYANLVYSCALANRAKSDDYCDLYLDPCDVDLNLHFFRDELGNICFFGDSKAAKYMFLKMKLYLRCYGIIWVIEQIDEKLKRADALFQRASGDENKELSMLVAELHSEYQKYKKYLVDFQDEQ